MLFDYSKLRGKIKEKFGTQEDFSKALGMDKSSLSLKLQNKREFTQYEMSKTCQVLDIPTNELQSYFFTESVKEIEHLEED